MPVRITGITRVLAWGVIGAAGGLAAVSAGCGGDDTVAVSGEAGGPADGTTEALTDAVAPDGTLLDGMTTDGASSNDADAAEAQADGALADSAQPDSAQSTDGAQADGGPELDSSDASSDASDGSVNEEEGGGQDAALTLANFPATVTSTYCARLEQCCGVTAAQWNDGGGGCIALTSSYGFFGVNQYTAAFDSGAISLDPAAASTCLAELSAFNCGTTSATAFDNVRADCFAAMVGHLGGDAGHCINSLECQPGEFCPTGPIGDAGSSTCVPLRSDGQPCGDTLNSTDCRFLGIGAPDEWCGAGPDGGNICQPTKPAAAACRQNPECVTGVCVYPSCVDSYIFSDPGVPGGSCATYTLTDAGDGG